MGEHKRRLLNAQGNPIPDEADKAELARLQDLVLKLRQLLADESATHDECNFLARLLACDLLSPIPPGLEPHFCDQFVRMLADDFSRTIVNRQASRGNVQ